MVRFNKKWSEEDKASWLQRRIIIASIIYYEYDQNIISDYDYNEMSKQYMQIIKKCNLDKTMYGYAFRDYDGSTGFDLFYKLNKEDQKYLSVIAQYLIGDVKSISYVAKFVPERMTNKMAKPLTGKELLRFLLNENNMKTKAKLFDGDPKLKHILFDYEQEEILRRIQSLKDSKVNG